VKDKELFQQLHNLGNMKPDATWKESQRSILLSQINVSEGAKQNSFFKDISNLSLDFMQSFSQPIVASFLLAFLFLTSGFVGLRAAQETKPGDSLYLAKIVGERTQLALAFTDKKKVELGLGFAAKRAQEIKQVIETEEVETGDRDEKVDKLIRDFKKEINAAKSRIGKISEDNADAAADSVAATDEPDESELVDEATGSTGNLEEVDNQIFSAGSSKTDQGLQISSNKVHDKTEQAVIKTIELELEATSTRNIQSSTTAEILEIETITAESILKEAGVLLEAEKYDEMFDILDNADEVVSQTFDQGEVRGVEENVDDVEVGTSTEE